MYMKRNCIFTNKPADSKFTIGSDKQNWAKSVPCTKEYLAERGDDPPTEREIRLVELFYEQELCRLRIEQYITQMDEIRALMSNKILKPLKKPEIYQQVEVSEEAFETTAEETKEALEKIGLDMIRQEIAEVEVPDSVNHYLGLKEQVDYTEIQNKIKRYEELTKEEEPVKVEKKKVVKKKSGNLWD